MINSVLLVILISLTGQKEYSTFHTDSAVQCEQRKEYIKQNIKEQDIKEKIIFLECITEGEVH
jgi:hypothetical protein